MQKALGRVFVAIGIFLLLASVILCILQIYPYQTTFSSVINNNDYGMESYRGDRLIISKLNIELPIYPSDNSDYSWESNYKGVSYQTSTVEPGEQGNSVLYGHNWKSLLGRLHELDNHDLVTIVYKNKSFDYKVTESKIVSSSDISILDNSSDSRITLYTCTGFLDSKRFVVVAERI